ncbi:MAG TPA: tetratricopeptide repeat protein [Anaerolineaceae bacterium]|jgi:putative thioredoxin
MRSDFIVNVSEEDFELEVINYSQNTPVVVDFWASWCVPCKVLSPMLEKLTNEAQGTFRLAKIDVDENPKLASRFGVRNIPAIKAFNQGMVISEFNGALPEPRVRDFIRNLAPSPSELSLEKGMTLLKLHQWVSAESAFRKLLETAPAHPGGLLGLAKSLLGQGASSEAALILRNFPASHEFNIAEMLRPLTEALVLSEKGAIPNSEEPLEAAYKNSIRLASRGNILAALDGLLDILRQNKRFHDGGARLVILGLLELLGDDDPQTRQYRSELASILF